MMCMMSSNISTTSPAMATQPVQVGGGGAGVAGISFSMAAPTASSRLSSPACIMIEESCHLIKAWRSSRPHITGGPQLAGKCGAMHMGLQSTTQTLHPLLETVVGSLQACFKTGKTLRQHRSPEQSMK